MKIGIYDPYLDTLGGGERYMLTAASCLSKTNQVNVFWDDVSILQKASEKFQIDLGEVHTTLNIFENKTSFIKRSYLIEKYDIIFFLSDGSIPVLTSKQNFLIIQHPVNWVRNGLLNRLKLANIKSIIVYSEFVKQFIDKTYGIKSIVLAPPVELMNYMESKKEKIILTVGRFTKSMNTKKQQDLIRIFQKMCDGGLKGWEFILIGSSMDKDIDLILQLKKSIQGYPVQILHNAEFKILSQYYEKAKIYWHGTGFGEDLVQHPERAEHFGISTVEAMSAGAVPVVINAGGQPEIVDDKINGFLWNTEEELIQKTKQVMTDEKLRMQMAGLALSKSHNFTSQKFCKQIHKLIK